MKKNVVFFFHLLLLLHHRSIDRVTKRQKRKKERKKERDFATQTNSSRITPPTPQHPGKKSEKKNKRSVVRSFVRHGRWRHPNEEEHLVETETTRWRGRRVRTFFFFRSPPFSSRIRLSFFPPRWKERSRVRES